MNAYLKKYLAVIISSLLFLPALAGAAGSAGISILPKSGSYKTGESFNMVISINPGSEKIDTVRAKLVFSKDVLEIKSFSIGSAFSYQAGTNSFDNSTGVFSWGAGAPGGISSTANFGTITFLVKKVGNASISVSRDSLALSAGEDKFNGQLDSASYSLLAATPSETQNTPVKKAQPATSQALEEPEKVESAPVPVINDVETQIISNQSSRNFGASLLNSLSFGTAIRIGAVLLLILAVMILGTFLYRKKINQEK